MLRKRSTSVSPRELLAKIFDKADFIVGKSVRYAVTLLVGVTTVAIIIAIVSLTRSKTTGETANTSNTNFVTTTTTITKAITSSVSTERSTSSTATNSTKPIFTTSATTYAKNTTKSIITTKKPPGSFDMHCAFAADLENFKEVPLGDHDAQKRLIKQLGKKVINTSSNSRAGLWPYGNIYSGDGVHVDTLEDVFEDMVADHSSFSQKVDDLKFGEMRSPPDGQNVIDHINNAIDKNNVANCLLFLTGSEEKRPDWKIEPSYDYYKRIVIISLRGADFTHNVDTRRGISLNVPLRDFNGSHIQTVYDEILKGFNIREIGYTRT